MNGGSTLFMWGNTWKAVKLPYKIAENTILEFDFKSTHQGEVHGIGFDTDTIHTAKEEKYWFKLFGTQKYANETYFAYKTR